MNVWPTISDLGLSAGKKARLSRILFQHGLGNGTALFLPYDQGLEHADLVKVNFPHPGKRSGVPAEYNADFSAQQAMDAVVRSANRTLVIVAGGSRAGDEAMLEKARQSAEAGATGLIFGRNVWQREHDESLRFVGKIHQILAKYPCQSIETGARSHRSFGEHMSSPS